MKHLYRGVNPDLYNELQGKLSPKQMNEKFASYACAGAPHALCGSGIEAGESELNSVIMHQWNQAGIPISGISTSPFVDRAKMYALNNGKYENGFIFKISVASLKNYGAKIYRVNDIVPFPAIPEDDEHVIVCPDFGSIPKEAIVEVIKIEAGI